MAESIYIEVLKIENLYKIISDYLNYRENNKFSLVNKKIYEFYINKKSIKTITLNLDISQVNRFNKRKKQTVMSIIPITTLKQLIKKHKGIIKVQFNNKKSRSLKLLLLLTQIKELKLTVTSVIDCFIFKNLKKLNTLTLTLDSDSYQPFEESQKESIVINYLNNLQKLTILANSPDKLSYIKYEENNTVTELFYFIDYSSKKISLEGIKKFKNLKFLKIECRNHCLSDMNFLKELKNLEKLSLKGFKYLDFSNLKGFNKLKSLNLVFNENSYLSFLKDACLEELSIIINGAFEFEFSVLKEIKSLKKLKIQYEYLNDLSFLENINDLEDLDLSGNEYIADYEPVSY